MPRDPRYDILFEPVRIGPKTLKNRFYQVPHCNGVGSNRPGTQAKLREMKAEGGWAAVCTEACSVDPGGQEQAPHEVSSLWDEGDVINLRHMCDSVHRWNALAGVELCHLGLSSPNIDCRGVSIAPVGATSEWSPQTYAHAADEDDIARVQGYFAEAARRAVQAGFDIIYVHAGHAVLTVQFLSRLYNTRTDRYGGPFENRVRFWRETLEQVKRAAGDGAAIATRISVDQLVGPDGVETHGEDIFRVVELFEREGLVDFFDLNVSNLDEWGEDAGTSRFHRANHQAPFTRHIKQHTKLPVINVGRLTSPDDMVQVIISGQADIIGAARPSIADPFLPRKIEEGRVEDIRECIGCNVCILRSDRGGQMVCTQNATSMEEYRRGWHPERFDRAPDPGWVLVVGAGPAGLECARVLAARGYDVHLREALPEIGGHVRQLVRYPGLAEWGRVIDYRAGQLAKATTVAVHRGVGAMTVDEVLAYEAEKVVLATGARWAGDGFSHITMRPIPGVDAASARVCTPEQVIAGKAIGERVLVLDADGYITGVGMAEHLADRGHGVTVVTQHAQVAPQLLYTLELPNVQRMLREKRIAYRPHAWVEAAEEAGGELRVRVYDVYRDGFRRTERPVAGELPRRRGDAADVLACDTLVLVTARIANDGLYKALRARRAEWAARGIKAVYQAGDCYAPRQLAEAIFDGHRIAREFESPDPQIAAPFIRERQIWGSPVYPTLG
ncbi:MAG: dimethylamine dehydrogenase [Alphaproteobacteria bacterium]|nr:dimethylamine dehydrogenase [Alphaproteobacteria bacterium]